MKKVKDYMTTKLISISPQTPVTEIIPLFLKHAVTTLPVVSEKGELVGVVTEGDILYRVKLPEIQKLLEDQEPFSDPKPLIHRYRKIGGKKAAQIMTPEPFVVDYNAPIEEAINLMIEKRFISVPVVRGRKIWGIISRVDVMKYLMEQERELEKHPLTDQEISLMVLTLLKKAMLCCPINQLEVFTENGKVRLSGQIDCKCSHKGSGQRCSCHDNDIVADLVSSITGVKEVENNLMVAGLLL